MMAAFWENVGKVILKPFADFSAEGETIFCLLIVPCAISAVWFWIVDGLLMKTDGSTRSYRKLRINQFSMEMEEYGDDDDDLLL